MRDALRWESRHLDGRTLVFRWRPDGGLRGDELTEKWNREAFAPTDKSRWLPDEEMIQPTSEPIWFADYFQGPGPLPASANHASFQWGNFHRLAGEWKAPFLCAWQISQFLPVAGLSGGAPTTPLAIHNGMVTTAFPEKLFLRPIRIEPDWLHSVDFGPAGLPILIRRNLRAAVRENPRHPSAHLLLAQTARTMIQQETWWTRRQFVNPRSNLRHIQVASALRNAIAVAPDNIELRREFAEMLGEQNFRDAAIEQIEEIVRIIDEKMLSGNRLSQDGVAYYAKQKDDVSKALSVMRHDLKRRKDDFALKAAAVPAMRKFRLAMREPVRMIDADNRETTDPRGRGLALEAVRILEGIDPNSLTEDERKERSFFLVRIHAFMGRIGEANNALNQAPATLGTSLPECASWIAVALGLYKNLDDALFAIEKGISEQPNQAAERLRALAFGLTLNQLGEMPLMPALVHAFGVDRSLAAQKQAEDANASAVADYRTLRAIFILERGDTQTALALFEQALAPNVPFSDQAIARRYRDLLRKYEK